MEARFEILSVGVRLQSERVIDNVFLTCCALHNELLEYDDLHNSSSTDELTEPSRPEDNEDINADIPNFPSVFVRMHEQSPAVLGEGEGAIGMGLPEGLYFEQQAADVETEVAINHDTFRMKLVKHFTHELKQNRVMWKGFPYTFSS